MSVPDAPVVSDVSAPARRYWLVFIVRALVAGVVALVITFSADHSALLGFRVFGGFAIAGGIVACVSSWIALERGVARSFLLAQGVVSVVLGIVAVVTSGASVPYFLFLLGAWAVFTGVLELYVGIRSRRLRVVQARDWVFAGALTLLLALGVLLVPASYSQHFTGPDGVARDLTASVVVVGLFGAYTAILAVYLVIAGLSLKWGTQRAPLPTAEGSN
ncbi:hypothetical protein BH11ACT2_BH11ACT2_15880 [soil metagenome]